MSDSKDPKTLRVRCWICVPYEGERDGHEVILERWVAVPVVVYGERAAYVLGLGARELYQDGYPPSCLLSAHRVDSTKAAQAVGEVATEDQRWYRAEAFDFLVAPRERRFLCGQKSTRMVDWADVDALWGSIRENIRDAGLRGLYFCVDVVPALVPVDEAGRIKFVVHEEIGATLRDEQGQVITTREGLRAGMQVTAYTRDLLTVHHDEAMGFYLGGRDSVMMTLEFTEGRGWHVGVVGNLSAIKRLEISR